MTNSYPILGRFRIPDMNTHAFTYVLGARGDERHGAWGFNYIETKSRLALIGTSNSLFLWFCVIGYICVCVCLSMNFSLFQQFCVFNFFSLSLFVCFIWFHFSVPLAFTLLVFYSISYCDTYHVCVCVRAFLSVSLSSVSSVITSHRWCFTVSALYTVFGILFKYFFLSLNGTNIVCNYFRWANKIVNYLSNIFSTHTDTYHTHNLSGILIFSHLLNKWVQSLMDGWLCDHRWHASHDIRLDATICHYSHNLSRVWVAAF